MGIARRCTVDITKALHRTVPRRFCSFFDGGIWKNLGRPDRLKTTQRLGTANMSAGASRRSALMGHFYDSASCTMLRIVAATCEVIRTVVHSTARIPESKRPTLIALGIVWVVSAVYIFGFIDRGWIPHDEGSLAQMAERVLNGELPHRDFDDIYTGGLSFLHALAFRLFGTTLLSLRLVLLMAFLAWLPAVYYVAGRFVPPLAAGLATLAG